MVADLSTVRLLVWVVSTPAVEVANSCSVGSLVEKQAWKAVPGCTRGVSVQGAAEAVDCDC